MFDSLLDESHFVKKKTAEAKAEGLAEARAEAEIEALRQLILGIVQARFIN